MTAHRDSLGAGVEDVNLSSILRLCAFSGSYLLQANQTSGSHFSKLVGRIRIQEIQ